MLSRRLVLVLVFTSTIPALAEEPATEPPATAPEAPLAGWSDGAAYLRSPGNFFQLFPNGRIQADGYVFVRPTDKLPVDTFVVKRAPTARANGVEPVAHLTHCLRHHAELARRPADFLPWAYRDAQRASAAASPSASAGDPAG